MKKIYLIAAALFFGVNANAQLSDDFESYPVGGYFGGHWTNWDGTSNNSNLIISEAQAHSGTKSGYIGTSPEQDAILDLGFKFDGVWTYSMYVYVEFGSSAYFNFQQNLNNLGDDNNWAHEFYLGVDPVNSIPSYGTGFVTSQGIAYPFNYNEEEWFKVTFVVDLDEGMTTMYLNDEKVILDPANDGSVPYGGDLYQLGGADFYSYSEVATNSYYIDDVVFEEGNTMAVKEMAAVNEVSVYPTVSKDFVNIDSKAMIQAVSVYNTAGQQMMKIAPNKSTAQIDVSSLPAGVYLLRIQSDKQVLTKKILVK